MKIILLVLAISTNVHVIFGDSTTHSSPRRDLDSTLEEKCFENSHSKYAFQDFKDAIINWRQCTVEAIGSLELHPVEQHEELCTYLKNSEIYDCFKILAVGVLPCLDQTEIFFPNMILKAYNTTFNEFCGSNGFNKTEYVFNKYEKNRKCIDDAKAEITLEGRCMENLTAYKNYQENIIDLNKDGYCNDMESFVSCTTELLEEKCDDDFTLIKDKISELLLGVCQE